MSCAAEAGCFCLTWNIENFDIFLLEYSDLTSAAWKTETTDGKNAVWWCMRVDHFCSDVRFDLVCLNATWHPDRWESSAISFCGETLSTNPKFTVFKPVVFFIKKKNIFGNTIHSNIPRNTLTLKCKMWQNSMKNGGFRIHSVVKKVDFCWCIKDPFISSTNYRPYSRNKVIDKDNTRINMIFDSKSENQYYICAVALPIMDGCFSFVYCKIISDGPVKKATQCVKSHEYNTSCTEYIKEWNIVEQRGVTPNTSCDLKLQLDFVVAHHNDYQYEVTNPTSLQLAKAGSTSQSANDPLSEDLLQLYRESILSDVTINTEGKSFPAHRSILAARSPVFRTKFEKDELNEVRSGVVDIDDVDSETMDRFLVFLYGGSLEGAKWEEVLKLYYAAKKSDVLPLQQKCADILKAGLTADNACDALVLADRHSDKQLMKSVVDFIDDHPEVVSSSKWEELDSRLTSKIATELFLKKGKK